MIYVMSNEEKDAQLGRLIRERKEAEISLAQYREQARIIGDRLCRLGTLLKNSPEKTGFTGLPTDIRFKVEQLVDYTLPTLDEVKTLVAAIQEKQVAVWTATKTLENLGI